MKKKHYIWILLIVLTSCTERKITPLIISYENDSITGVTLRIKSNKIQEWKYSLKGNCEISPAKYQEYLVSNQFIDSLKVLLPSEQEFNTGRIYCMGDWVNHSEFIIVFGDSISAKNVFKVSDKVFTERLHRILTLTERQKYKIIPPSPKTKSDSLLIYLDVHEHEPIRLTKK